MLKHLLENLGLQVKEGLEYYHSLYSPYNRTIQARLFANIRLLSSSSPIFNKQSYPAFSSIHFLSISVNSDFSSDRSFLHYDAPLFVCTHPHFQFPHIPMPQWCHNSHSGLILHYHCKGRDLLKKVIYFRVLPESGGGDYLCPNLLALFTR